MEDTGKAEIFFNEPGENETYDVCSHILIQCSLAGTCVIMSVLTKDDDALERASYGGDLDLPPDDVFNMIVQAPWEEDIVWSSEEYNPSKKSIIAQNSAGWVPSGNIRTLQGYLANTYRKGMCSYFLVERNHIIEESVVIILCNDEKYHPSSNHLATITLEFDQTTAITIKIIFK